MCYTGWQDRLRKLLTLNIFALTIVALTSKLCFLGYWVRSEVNEDIPVTPGFSLHLYTNSTLALFCLASIIVNVKMYLEVYFESCNVNTFTWICHLNIFLVASFFIFSLIFTFLYTSFPVYKLVAPFVFKTQNYTTKSYELKIPTWLDRFQKKYKCCGMNSYLDYKDHEDQGDYYLNDQLPASCCQHSKDNWSVKPCTMDAFLMIPVSTELIVNSQGCNEALEEAIKVLTLFTMTISWIISGLNIIGMIAFGFQFKRNRHLHLYEGNASQTPEIFGDSSDTMIAQQQNSLTDTGALRNKPTSNSLPKKTIDYTVHGNISTLFNNSNINATNSLRRSRKTRQHQPVTHKSNSHPYDYFSRHGLSNVP